MSPLMDKSFRTSTADGAVVEFGLVRHALLAKLADGSLRHEDICDAHPELLRAELCDLGPDRHRHRPGRARGLDAGVDLQRGL